MDRKNEALLCLHVEWSTGEQPQKPKLVLQQLFQCWLNRNRIEAECDILNASMDGSVVMKITPVPVLDELWKLRGQILATKEGKTVMITSVSLTPPNLETQIADDLSMTPPPSFMPEPQHVEGQVGDQSSGVITPTCDIPISHYWYVNQAYKEEIKHIEEESGVEIIAEVKLTFKAGQNGNPNDAFSKYINLLQKCSAESRGFSVPVKNVKPGVLKDTQEIIQRAEHKLLLTLSSQEMSIYGSRHGQHVIRESLNATLKGSTDTHISARESPGASQRTSPGMSMEAWRGVRRQSMYKARGNRDAAEKSSTYNDTFSGESQQTSYIKALEVWSSGQRQTSDDTSAEARGNRDAAEKSSTYNDTFSGESQQTSNIKALEVWSSGRQRQISDDKSAERHGVRRQTSDVKSAEKDEDQVIFWVSVKWSEGAQPRKAKVELQLAVQIWANKRGNLTKPYNFEVLQVSDDGRAIIRITPAPAVSELQKLHGQTLTRKAEKTVMITSVSLTPPKLEIQTPDRASVSRPPSVPDPQHERNEENCPICMDTFTNKTQLGCKHEFCEDCLRQAVQNMGQICPLCKYVFGKLEGNQPDGTMSVYRDSSHLPGFTGCGTIIINYDIPGGTQTKKHPHPGQSFHGARRSAYLPDNKEGNEVVQLLRRAFDQKLIFTVGTSRTSGMDNQVVWNDIHHKTSTTGGAQNFGYPDPAYLSRVKDELKAKGIK